MQRLRLYTVFWSLTVAVSQTVNFPYDGAQEQRDHPDTRMGLKYLGYFLSLLSSSFAGYQESSIQTSTGSTTIRPETPLPLFSAFPISPPAVMNRTVPPVTATVVPNLASTFPTALPTSFPTGIITSYGTIPPVTASAAAAPLIAAGGNVCGCLPASVCVNQTTRSGISVRIVTNPPEGITCSAGLVYCCSPNVNYLCGVQNIVPGITAGPNQANIGEYPWSAIILTDGDAYVGGGALIDDIHVITATHKVASYGNGSNLKVRLGEWNLSAVAEPVRAIEVKVKGIVNHPDFDRIMLTNDISILTLTEAVPILTSSYPQINTICLPQTTDTFVGSRCWVAGWGKDQFNGAYQQVIKKVDVPVVSAADCQARLRQTRLGSSFVLNDRSFLCAGGEASKDACTGDGGNALACERNGQFYFAGITVGGIECGMANVPGLYTNMVNFLPWINRVLNKTPPGIDPRKKPSS